MYRRILRSCVIPFAWHSRQYEDDLRRWHCYGHLCNAAVVDVAMMFLLILLLLLNLHEYRCFVGMIGVTSLAAVFLSLSLDANDD